jgi:hypothetical protein
VFAASLQTAKLDNFSSWWRWTGEQPGNIFEERRGPIKTLSFTSDLPMSRSTTCRVILEKTHELFLGLHVEGLKSGSMSGEIRIRTDDPAFPEINVPVQGDQR